MKKELDIYREKGVAHPYMESLDRNLIPQHESNLQRGNSMKLLDEFVVKEGSNDSIQYELERKLSIKYCKKGFYVYSDQHMCKKCREPKT